MGDACTAHHFIERIFNMKKDNPFMQLTESQRADLVEIGIRAINDHPLSERLQWMQNEISDKPHLQNAMVRAAQIDIVQRNRRPWDIDQVQIFGIAGFLDWLERSAEHQ
jgi:hypothetical protein